MQDERLRPFIETPESCALFTDFDGTLSEIVPDPSAARPVAGVTEVLGQLGQKLALVAVVSGRSADQLLEWLGPGIEIWGVHGAERVEGGRIIDSDRLMPYLDRMRRVRKEAQDLLAREAGVIVEDKRSVVALHYRQAPDPDGARQVVERTAANLAVRYELVTGAGRMVVELKPPVEFSKAEVVLNRAREVDARAVVFAGDDLVDLPAFDALDELERDGRTCLRIAVSSGEAPSELLDRADLVVEGPEGLVAWLMEVSDLL